MTYDLLNAFKEYFKDDVIISCLCVGYLVPIEEVKCKRLIINGFDKKRKAIAKMLNNKK